MEFKKIGIIHLNQIGDLVFSLPLLKALKDNNPSSRVHSIVRPYLKEVLTHFPYVDDLLCRKRGIRNLFSLMTEIRRNRYDLLISLSRSQECLLLTAFSRAKIKVGFCNFPWDFGLDIKEEIEGHHSWYNNLKLLKKLGIAVEKNDYIGLLALPPRKDSEGWKGFHFPQRYVVISPGTSKERRVKAWEEEKFGALIIQLKKRHNLDPVLVGGKDNREMNDKIIELASKKDEEKMLNDAKNLAGEIGLEDLCYLLKEADLFVGVDSGIMHLASSFDTPVVGLFGPTDPFYVGPQNQKSRVVREEMECAPCYLRGCEDRTCMKKLDVKKVLDACEQLLHPLR